jgi:hypothetical protein
MMKKTYPHGRHSQSGAAVFRLILIGFGCGKAKGLPEQETCL